MVFHNFIPIGSYITSITLVVGFASRKSGETYHVRRPRKGSRLYGTGAVLCYNEAKIPEQPVLSKEGQKDESIF